MASEERLRILIVDDEPLGRRSVAREVAVVFPGALVEEARDGFEALELVARFVPDVLFLDVDMPELSGLDVLRQLPEPRPRVVFVTAFEHFALGAFEQNACDFLVKPFTSERFARAAERARSELDADARLRALEQSLAGAGRHLTRLALRLGNRVEVVALAEVSCLLSKEHYTYLYAGGREYISELTLVHFEERLEPAVFGRVHRNALVNFDRVTRLEDADELVLVLADGQRVAVSRRHRRTVLERLGQGA